MTDNIPDAGKVTDDTEGDELDRTPEGDTTAGTPEGSDPESDPAIPEFRNTDEPETFPRAYVEQLRNENAKYRQRAGEADSLAKRLHVELVRATGRLADPTDLPFDADHLADAGNMVAALDELLAAKPHLAARKPVGDIGQGSTSSAASVDLAAILRGKA